MTINLQYTPEVNMWSNDFILTYAFVTYTGSFSSIVVLYNDFVSSSDFVASNVTMIGEK